jgi:hypothetical protein
MDVGMVVNFAIIAQAKVFTNNLDIGSYVGIIPDRERICFSIKPSNGG